MTMRREAVWPNSLADFYHAHWFYKDSFDFYAGLPSDHHIHWEMLWDVTAHFIMKDITPYQPMVCGDALRHDCIRAYVRDFLHTYSNDWINVINHSDFGQVTFVDFIKCTLTAIYNDESIRYSGRMNYSACVLNLISRGCVVTAVPHALGLIWPPCNPTDLNDWSVCEHVETQPSDGCIYRLGLSVSSLKQPAVEARSQYWHVFMEVFHGLLYLCRLMSFYIADLAGNRLATSASETEFWTEWQDNLTLVKNNGFIDHNSVLVLVRWFGVLRRLYYEYDRPVALHFCVHLKECFEYALFSWCGLMWTCDVYITEHAAARGDVARRMFVALREVHARYERLTCMRPFTEDLSHDMALSGTAIKQWFLKLASFIEERELLSLPSWVWRFFDVYAHNIPRGHRPGALVVNGSPKEASHHLYPVRAA